MTILPKLKNPQITESKLIGNLKNVASKLSTSGTNLSSLSSETNLLVDQQNDHTLQTSKACCSDATGSFAVGMNS